MDAPEHVGPPLPKIKDFGLRLGPRKPYMDNLKHSAFFVTVNTNKGHNQCVVSLLAEDLRNVIKKMLEEDLYNSNIIKFLEGEESDIITVDGDLTTEIGSEKNGSRVHSHFILQFQHKAKIHLSNRAIQGYVVENITACSLSSVHVDIKVITFATQRYNLLEYMTKNSTM